MKTIATIAVALALGACSSLPDTVQNGDPRDEIAALTELAKTDIESALSDARAHKDKAAVLCYSELLDKIEDLPKLTASRVVGPVSAFQKARNIRKRIDEGVSEDVEIACAALANETRGTLRRIVRLVGGGVVPGL